MEHRDVMVLSSKMGAEEVKWVVAEKKCVTISSPMFKKILEYFHLH